MLSKCLNPRCSATFQYLDQGRLFRIDFNEAARKRASSGTKKDIAFQSKAHPIEHFWLCQECAQTMTVALDERDKVGLIALHPEATPSEAPLWAPRGALEASAF
jgi:uncharacterized protein YlaI